MFVKERYAIPMIIAETGTDGASDERRIESWLVRHLAWTKRAIKDGADVRGFFYWSLTDNYEWNHGMAMKFGLNGVANDQAKTLTAMVTDNLSGVGGVFYSFTPPNGGGFSSSMSRVSGTALNGVYSTTQTVPRYSRPGFTSISLFSIRDAANNGAAVSSSQLISSGFPGGFTTN